MSLYNLIHGFNEACFFYLPMLGKHPNGYPRFRDCFTSDPDHPEYDDHIHVYTRVGGNNREDYESDIECLRDHPEYVTDYDDALDNTFATFIFTVPEQWKADFEILKTRVWSNVSAEYIAELKRVLPKLVEKIDEIFTGAQRYS